MLVLLLRAASEDDDRPDRYEEVSVSIALFVIHE